MAEGGGGEREEREGEGERGEFKLSIAGGMNGSC